MGILLVGIFCTIYGILGFFGIQSIPERFKDQVYTKSYKRDSGLNFLILGICWILISMVIMKLALTGVTSVLVSLAAGLPALGYAIYRERKYANK